LSAASQFPSAATAGEKPVLPNALEALQLEMQEEASKNAQNQGESLHFSLQ
jgi:hypothetical protein